MSMSGPAVLSSALLARKGTAVPTGYSPVRPDAGVPARTVPDTSRPEPVAAPVRLAVAGHGPAGKPAKSAKPNERARVSVRLDKELHLKLKLSAAHLDQSLQDVVTDALEKYLEQLSPEILRSECRCLGFGGAGEAAGSAGGRSD